MPIGSTKYTGTVRHAVDYTLFGGQANIPQTMRAFPGFLQKETDQVKRVSFVTANGTNYRKEFQSEIYSLDSRKLQFDNLFSKANSQIPNWEETVRTYDFAADGITADIIKDLPIPEFPWVPVIAIVGILIYFNRNDKSR